MPLKKSDINLPSTSKSHNKDFVSPISPNGRIAKRNARLINEVDLSSKRSGAYSDGVVNMILDLKSCDLAETCPIIKAILEDGELYQENLTKLQHQAEELLSQNVDTLKTLHGEITYLNTGEYPIVQLNDRAMPTFTLRKKPSIEDLNGVPMENFAELGLNSPPDENEEEDPGLLDVPQRFWNWTREYLRHITEDYEAEFKEKLVDRYDEKECSKYFFKPQFSPTKQFNGKTNNNSNKDDEEISNTKNKVKKRKHSVELVEITPRKIRPDNSPPPIFKLSDNSPATGSYFASIDSCINKDHPSKILNGSKSPTKMDISKTSNGIEDEWSEDEDKDQLLDSPPPPPAMKINGNSNGICANTNCSSLLKSNGVISNSTKNGQQDDDEEAPQNLIEVSAALAAYGVKKGLIPRLRNSIEFNDIKPETLFSTPTTKKMKLDEADDESTDEVSREIKKKQMEFSSLYAETRPLIMDLYERAQAEHVLYETNRLLDLADDKLFELGSKYERLSSFNKEQRNECKAALLEREKAANLFYYRHQKPSAMDRTQAISQIGGDDDS